MVFVLGAGFTRAFVPEAPLLRGDFGLSDLAAKYEHLPFAKHILEGALCDGPTNTDIEKLLTRVEEGLPYDVDPRARPEASLLKSDILQAFLAKVRKAQQGTVHRAELDAFAQLCLKSGATCVTFNYDDALDQSLWEVNMPVTETLGEQKGWLAKEAPKPPQLEWHPNSGYGFFCRAAAYSVVGSDFDLMGRSDMQLLKLHGSLNWRVRLGSPTPLQVESVVHLEDWLIPDERKDMLESIELHLESDPYVIPPSLTKTGLSEHPVFRIVWDLAYRSLSSASEVVFVGYSLPVTDLATAFLFSESLAHLDKSAIRVVNRASDAERQAALKARYRALLGKIPDDNFEFRDALEWAQEIGT